MALQPPLLHFVDRRDVKLAWLVEELHMGRRQVIQALAWLVTHGYVVEHGRDPKGVRSLTLAYALERAA